MISSWSNLSGPCVMFHACKIPDRGGTRVARNRVKKPVHQSAVASRSQGIDPGLVRINLDRADVTLMPPCAILDPAHQLATGSIDIVAASGANRSGMAQIIKPLLKTHHLIARWGFIKRMGERD